MGRPAYDGLPPGRGRASRAGRGQAARGGLYTLTRGALRIHCIWKTYAGGNHYTYVHVGSSRDEPFSNCLGLSALRGSGQLG